MIKANAPRTYSHTYTGDNLETLADTKPHRPIIVDRGGRQYQNIISIANKTQEHGVNCFGNSGHGTDPDSIELANSQTS